MTTFCQYCGLPDVDGAPHPMCDQMQGYQGYPPGGPVRRVSAREARLELLRDIFSDDIRAEDQDDKLDLVMLRILADKKFCVGCGEEVTYNPSEIPKVKPGTKADIICESCCNPTCPDDTVGGLCAICHTNEAARSDN